MFKTILIIVFSVTVFGILFFLYVKKKLKNQLDYYLSKNNKKKSKNWTYYNILQNLTNSSFGISKTFFDVS